MSNDTTFWTVDDKRGDTLPQWARTTATAGADLYVPAAIAGYQCAIALRATLDGEPSIACFGHMLVRADWQSESMAAIEL